MLAGHIPEPELLPATEGNKHGLQRLRDIYADETLPQVVREEFMRDFGEQLRRFEKPPEDLFDIMNKIVYSHEGQQKYQRKGVKIPNIAYVRDVLGGLRRCMALRALCKPGMLSPEFYARAQETTKTLGRPDLPVYSALSWGNGAQAVVELVNSGAIDFVPERDLMATGIVEGRGEGDSGWFFAGADADVSDVPSAQSQLAIGGAYLQGYVVVDLPPELALPDPGSGHPGAARPTALDLTNDPLGKLNPNRSEPTGRTNPQTPGQRSVREVVMPPLPLAVMTKRTYVGPKGSK
jgi:hypothetical protein